MLLAMTIKDYMSALSSTGLSFSSAERMSPGSVEVRKRNVVDCDSDAVIELKQMQGESNSGGMKSLAPAGAGGWHKAKSS